MRWVIFILLVLVLTSFVSAEMVSNSPTEVRITVVNESSSTTNTGPSGDDDDSGNSAGTITQEEICKVSWECSEWDECSNFKKSRVCIDENECSLEPKIDTNICISELILYKEPLTKIPIWAYLVLFIILITTILLLIRKIILKEKIRLHLPTVNPFEF